jgi:Mn2+/Fe2+ NRAMP family transporter
MKLKQLLTIIGPGILVTATGVGAGDLATGAFTGQKLGVAVLWAVIVGAFLKFVLNEGLTRWQLATGDTLLEGCVTHIGRPFRWIFLVYLLIWSFLVSMALMSACGVTMHAMFPLGVFGDWFTAERDKIIYGCLLSLIAVVLVRRGGYQIFEKVMTVCIGVMVLIVVGVAAALHPPIGDVLKGLFVPAIPHFGDGGLDWTIALLGGVGGTLTILCYGYWIREEGRHGTEALKTCRIDLALGYAMTMLFGMSMLVIGSRVPELKGGGAKLLVELAASLEAPFGAFGPAIRWAFLIGAFGAVFSSLLGVWQCIPYLFADFCELSKPRQTEGKRPEVKTDSVAYRGFLYGLAIVPVIGLCLVPFSQAQKVNAIVGSLVIPALAGILLYLNNRTDLVGAQFRNRRGTNFILILSLLFFLLALIMEIRSRLSDDQPVKEPAAPRISMQETPVASYPVA